MLTRAHAAQGGVTLGPEQGEPGANFCYLGMMTASASGTWGVDSLSSHRHTTYTRPTPPDKSQLHDGLLGPGATPEG
jgi:hypothetical protein